MYPNASERTGRRASVVRGLLSRRAFLLGLMSIGLCVNVHAGADDKDSNTAQTTDVVYEPGGDVKPPKLLHYVEPAFSPSSKEAFVEGTVKISTVVTTEGIATKLRVTSGLNAEEDRTAMEAVKQWKFQPGTKAGQPVNVRVNVEVTFHLL